MMAADLDDMFAPHVIADSYGYYARFPEIDPVHWNERYQLWVIESRPG